VRAIADSNIGIMGHVGLTPQSATKLGGFKAQGRTGAAAKKLFDDALALQEAGAFAIVLEAVPAPVAARVSAALDVPTIGIGAGAGTDGQVLVWHDMLGMYAGRTPRFVKRYADIASEIGDAVSQYADDVRTGAFPEEQHTYGITPEELDRFEAAVKTT
jgi:3-methyl-2-oxobutanoate hydroxymethyltransferase